MNLLCCWSGSTCTHGMEWAHCTYQEEHSAVSSMWATVDSWFERKKERGGGIDCLGATPSWCSATAGGKWGRGLQLGDKSQLQLQPAAIAATCVSSNGYSYFFSACLVKASILSGCLNLFLNCALNLCLPSQSWFFCVSFVVIFPCCYCYCKAKGLVSEVIPWRRW